LDTAFDLYVCPHCHGRLDSDQEGFSCERCHRRYPLRDGIPDFLVGEALLAAKQIQQMERLMAALARIYETRLWYQTVLDLYAGWRVTTLAELIRLVSDMVAIDRGLVLDVACGPGTYGRRVASAERRVYGIDLSLGMLRQGRRLSAREGRHMHFARAHVEQMPFPDRTFDAVICGGSLHLFPDTGRALREIARTARSGAPLAVVTFMPGPRGLLKYRWAQRRLRERRGFHVFEIPEMAAYLQQAGFTDYAPQTLGSLLVYSARRM